MRRLVPLTALLLAPLLLPGCATNPFTGRSQLMLIGRDEELALGRHGYQQILAESRVSLDPVETAPVIRVSRRIARAAEELVREKGMDVRFLWEFNVIKADDTANAFALPGGKIAVYTGIFPVCRDENGLAVVIGHEVAHALARHGAERVSQEMLKELGAVLLAAALRKKSRETVLTALAAYGIVSNIGVLLPFSRAHETEADRLGLMLAARAGYDPRAGVEIWRRMQEMHGGGPPEFLSTHPSHETRIANMESWMPQMLAIYERVPKAPSRPLVMRGAVPQPSGRAPPFSAAGVRPYLTDEGRPALQFAFAAGRDAYIEKITVTGPGGLRVPIQAKATILADQKKVVNIWRGNPGDPPLPRGRYTVALVGRASGRPFHSSLDYDFR